MHASCPPDTWAPSGPPCESPLRLLCGCVRVGDACVAEGGEPDPKLAGRVRPPPGLGLWEQDWPSLASPSRLPLDPSGGRADPEPRQVPPEVGSRGAALPDAPVHCEGRVGAAVGLSRGRPARLTRPRLAGIAGRFSGVREEAVVLSSSPPGRAGFQLLVDKWQCPCGFGSASSGAALGGRDSSLGAVAGLEGALGGLSAAGPLLVSGRTRPVAAASEGAQTGAGALSSPGVDCLPAGLGLASRDPPPPPDSASAAPCLAPSPLRRPRACRCVTASCASLWSWPRTCLVSPPCFPGRGLLVLVSLAWGGGLFYAQGPGQAVGSECWAGCLPWCPCCGQVGVCVACLVPVPGTGLAPSGASRCRPAGLTWVQSRHGSPQAAAGACR